MTTAPLATASKPTLRRLAADRRRHLAATDAAATDAAGAAQRFAERFQAAIPVPSGSVIAGYWPIRSELDPRALMHLLWAAGHEIVLPVVTGTGSAAGSAAGEAPLIFRQWHPEQSLTPGAYGIPVPSPSAPERTPAILLVPLLAFDRLGRRLGYGGGYYDRTLFHLRRRPASPTGAPVRAIGVGFAGQEVAEVPWEPWDQPLDWMVTDVEAFPIPNRIDAALSRSWPESEPEAPGDGSGKAVSKEDP